MLLDTDALLEEGTAGGMPGLVLYFMDLQIVTRICLKEMPSDLLDDKIVLMTNPNGGYIIVVTTANNLGVWQLKIQGE